MTCEKLNDSIKKGFYSGPVYNEKYLKTKEKSWGKNQPKFSEWHNTEIRFSSYLSISNIDWFSL